jgi:hypothetical protein
MDQDSVTKLSELLFEFRNSFGQELTTEERNALIKVILTVEFQLNKNDGIPKEDRAIW